MKKFKANQLKHLTEMYCNNKNEEEQKISKRDLRELEEYGAIY